MDSDFRDLLRILGEEGVRNCSEIRDEAVILPTSNIAGRASVGRVDIPVRHLHEGSETCDVARDPLARVDSGQECPHSLLLRGKWFLLGIGA